MNIDLSNYFDKSTRFEFDNNRKNRICEPISFLISSELWKSVQRRSIKRYATQWRIQTRSG